jgi:hypothetical protein
MEPDQMTLARLPTAEEMAGDDARTVRAESVMQQFMLATKFDGWTDREKKIFLLGAKAALDPWFNRVAE